MLEQVREVGYGPATPVEESVSHFVEWYRAYYRIRHDDRFDRDFIALIEKARCRMVGVAVVGLQFEARKSEISAGQIINEG